VDPITSEQIKAKDMFKLAFYDILKNAKEKKSYDSKQTLKKILN